MQQLFNTRNYSIRDFEEWDSRNELVLQPKFQRRDVWSDKARSYLIDTIVRGKPIPKISSVRLTPWLLCVTGAVSPL